MYENNNMNGQNGPYTGQNANRTSYGTYMQNNPGYYASQTQFNPGNGTGNGNGMGNGMGNGIGNGNAGPGIPNKPKKKSGGMLKKLVAAASVGLFAGAFCAVGFIGIYTLGRGMGLIGKEKDEDDNKPVAYSAAAQVTPATPTVGDKPTVTTASVSSTKTVVSDVSEMVDDVMPSIVSITNNMTADYFYFSQEEEGRGSGIIIGKNDDEYLIVTNYHVIADNDRLTVTFSNDTDSPALVKGTDAKIDLAVIAVKQDDIPEETRNYIEVASMGDSDALKVGEPAIAIGNALGYGLSVTTGVVSAVDRKLDQDSVSGTFIQTDAAINPGNSGGALVDSDGKVIGINTLIASYSGNYSGVGFAIPINYAINIADQIIDGKTPTHAKLGVSLVNVTSQVAKRYNLASDYGAYVQEVSAGSGAENAGIEAGDIIIAFDGEKVSSSTDLTLDVREHNPGDTVTITVNRNGEEKSFDVTLGSDEQELAAVSAQSQQSGTEQQNPYGGNGNGSNRGYEGYSYEDLLHFLDLL